MSDERPSSFGSDEGGADDAVTSAGLEPGGGPQRVVSERTVDDILDSLDESESTSVTVTDEDDAADSDPAAPDEADEDDDRTASDSRSEPADETRSPAVDDATGADSSARDSASIDAAASSLSADPPEASLEDLAARVEDGTVTGADVRAAEAGEGRESTRSIAMRAVNRAGPKTTVRGCSDGSNGSSPDSTYAGAGRSRCRSSPDEPPSGIEADRATRDRGSDALRGRCHASRRFRRRIAAT
ncbi:hypothetical protein [Natrinema caseinilyticum]|uniref:hypothetical protein n=1 Tax=Natrinema caseinilyticum TaxID=2961570 RepID=UPI0030F4A4AB